MEERRIVTTSWDDGDRTDMRVGELLRSRGIEGTFYVPITPFGVRPALNHAELRTLSSERFEIGAHGFSHRLLRGLATEELTNEVSRCKPLLEDILGTEVRMFCYPNGRYDSNVIRCLRQAGYWGARTVRMLATGLEFKPFEMPTTLQSFPHSKAAYIRNAARAQKIEGLKTCLSEIAMLSNWLQLGKRLFDSVLQNGGIWHLYGHSWEIDQLGLWTELKELLDYVCKRKEVIYVPNWKVLGLLSANSQNSRN